MKKYKIFWIGIQESEISYTSNIFLGSITIFGTGKNGNYSFDKEYNLRYNYNLDNDLWIDFVNSSANKIIKKYPDCSFLLYYPMDATLYDQSVTSRLISINDIVKLDMWDNKLKCREWLGNDIPVVPCEICYGKEIFSRISNEFYENKEIVIQGEYSCGGSQTWLLENINKKFILSELSLNKLYSISKFIKNNISVNVHLVIYSNEIVILPASIQIIKLANSSFEYQGADFIAYQYLPQNIKNKVEQYSQIIGERLRNSGYRGICGIDYITTESEVYFAELNPRFQSSSFLINMALSDFNYDCCLQQLHLDAFAHKKCQYDISKLNVNYSFYKVTYSSEHLSKLKKLFNQSKDFNQVMCIDDDIKWNMSFEENTYLYKLVFKRNICAISKEFDLIIHPNLLIEENLVDFAKKEQQMLELKIMLLSHGITISKEAEQLLKKVNGINYKEFEALDLVIENKYYISVPYQTEFAPLSPFKIDIYDEKLYLFYYDTRMFSVFVRGEDPLANRTTKAGIAFSEISYLGHDRLRIYHRLGCHFKQLSKSCDFCDIDNDNRILTLASIQEVIETYKNHPQIKHFLIGGGSQPPNDDFEFVCKIAKLLKKTCSKPIYLMSLPMKNRNILNKLKVSGVTEVAFNIEIYDRKIAELYMPGKGLIPLTTYLDALKEAVSVFGNTGGVRSIFIVGLEPKETLLKGIEEVCKIGVSPILSLFKPIENTPLHYLLPPSDAEILDIVIKAEDICKKYGVQLGPTCSFCEDNTLKITR